MSATQVEEPAGVALQQVLQPHKRPKRAPSPRPMKLVCVDGCVVADASLIVSPCDPNYWHRGRETKGLIEIRRP